MMEDLTLTLTQTASTYLWKADDPWVDIDIDMCLGKLVQRMQYLGLRIDISKLEVFNVRL